MIQNTRKTWLAGTILGLVCLASVAGAQPYDNYVWQFPVVTNISSGADWMKTVLQAEAQKILDAGHLAPLYLGRGDSPGYNYYMYWERSRIVTTLAWAYPYLTTAQQSAARTYVQTELSTAAYAPWNTSPKYLDPAVGARREYSGPTKVWYWADFWDGTKLAQHAPVHQYAVRGMAVRLSHRRLDRGGQQLERHYLLLQRQQRRG